MKLIQKSLADLTRAEYEACKRLNFRNTGGPSKTGGYMYRWLSEFKDASDVGIVMLWESNTLHGWAMLVPTSLVDPADISAWHRRKCKYAINVYVREGSRGRGLGSILMNHILTIDPYPYVWPHDTRSGGFYSNFKLGVPTWRRKYIKRREKVAA